MSLSILAILLSIVYLYLVLNPKESHKLFEKLVKQDEIRMLYGMGLLFLSFVILIHTRLNFNWSGDGLLTWVGILVALKGAFVIHAPKQLEKKLKLFRAESFPALGTLGLVIMMLLIFLDLKLL